MNRCVGCQACVIACQIENYSVQSEPWRNVSTFNAFQHPLLPLFHFSLACNHCEIPLCMEHCPSSAYSKNESLQTIDHDSDRCIGCRYCTWACPYDAPKFIHARGVVEKCTLCKERIEVDLKPNCANLCPTGALDFGDIKEEPVAQIPGFVDKGIRPGIKIIPLRKAQPPHPITSFLEDKQNRLYKQLALRDRSKVNLKQEWPLTVFTILTSLLFGLTAASLFNPIAIDPIAFFVAGIVGMALSTLHLGKKVRAWRAIANWKTSWLSREVGTYLLFLALCGLSFLMYPGESMRVAASLAGLATLISMDMVYTVAEKKPMPGLTSASVLVTGLLFFSALLGMMWLFVIVTGWKFIFYSLEFVRPPTRDLPRVVLSVFRIVVGFILPFMLLGSPSGRIAAGILLVVAELINRAEFYVDLEFLSPQRQINKDLLEELDARSVRAEEVAKS